MGGEVAISIRKKGQQETREFSKHAASEFSTQGFFQGKGLIHEEWKKLTPRQFAPIDYGLVAVDYDRKWVGSLQSYTNLDTHYCAGLLHRRDADQSKAELSKLFRAGRLVSLKGIEGAGLPGDEGFDPWFQQLIALAKKQNVNFFTAKTAPPRGWIMEEFPNNKQGWEAFTKKLVGGGWEFSDEDIAAWEAFADYRDMGGFSIQSIRAQSMYEQLDDATASTAPKTKSRQRL